VEDRDVERARRLKVADAALVDRAVVPEDVGLPGHALPEAEEHRLRDGRRAVADRVRDAAAVARDPVGVRPVVEGERGARLQDPAVGRRFGGVGHRRGLLCARLSGVALRAAGRARVADARVVVRGTPPRRGLVAPRLPPAAREKRPAEIDERARQKEREGQSSLNSISHSLS
jgi:hypothetical protein